MELIGHNIDDRKRSGLVDQTIMDTDGVLQHIGFTGRHKAHRDAILSDADCIATSKTKLAKLAPQVSLSKLIF